MNLTEQQLSMIENFKQNSLLNFNEKIRDIVLENYIKEITEPDYDSLETPDFTDMYPDNTEFQNIGIPNYDLLTTTDNMLLFLHLSDKWMQFIGYYRTVFNFDVQKYEQWNFDKVMFNITKLYTLLKAFSRYDPKQELEWLSSTRDVRLARKYFIEFHEIVKNSIDSYRTQLEFRFDFLNSKFYNLVVNKE